MSGFILLDCRINDHYSGFSVIDLNKWVVHEKQISKNMISSTMKDLGFESKAEYIKHYPGKYAKTNKSSYVVNFNKNNFIEVYGFNYSELGFFNAVFSDIIKEEQQSTFLFPELFELRRAAEHEGIPNADTLSPWWCEDSVGW